MDDQSSTPLSLVAASVLLPSALHAAGLNVLSAAALATSFRALQRRTRVSLERSPVVLGAGVAFVLTRASDAARGPLDAAQLLLAGAAFEALWTRPRALWAPLAPPQSDAPGAHGQLGQDGAPRASFDSGAGAPEAAREGDRLLLSQGLVLASVSLVGEAVRAAAALGGGADGASAAGAVGVAGAAGAADLQRSQAGLATAVLLCGTALSSALALLLPAALLGPSASSAALTTLLAACVAGVPLLIEYPLLFGALGEEPIAWASRFAIGPSPAAAEARGPELVAWWASASLFFVLVAAMLEAGGSERIEQRLGADVQAIEAATREGAQPTSGVGAAAAAGAARRAWSRKLFHAGAVIMFAPAPLVGGWAGAALLGLALAVALKVAAALETGRSLHRRAAAGRGPLPHAAWASVDRCVATFEALACGVGGEGSPALALGHIYLLIGCAAPVWLTLAAARAGRLPASLSASSGPQATQLPDAALLLLMAGVVGVGVGDATAAVVGSAAKAAGRAHTWGAIFQGVWDRTIGSLDAADHETWVARGAALRDGGAGRSEGEGEEEGKGEEKGEEEGGGGEGRGSGAEGHSTPPSNASKASDESATSDSIPQAPQRWPGHDKTVEGTAAFAASALLASVALCAARAALGGQGLGGRLCTTSEGLALVASALVAALAESFVEVADNVVVPVSAWLAGLLACFALEAGSARAFARLLNS